MGFKKVISKRTIVWASVSTFLIALFTVANVLTRTTLVSLVNGALGGQRAKDVQVNENVATVFKQDFATKKEALDNANSVVEKICDEGMILLKNDNNALPLAKNAKVSVFGKNSVKLVYGGSGSAAPGGSDDSSRKTIFDSLTAAGIQYNPTLKSFYEGNSSGSGRSANPAMENNGVATLKTGETPISSYKSDVTSSYDNYGDAALIVLPRIAGENWDLPRKASDNEDRTYLDLDNNERDLIAHVCNSGKFEHVVIILNGSNYIDLGFLEKTTDPAFNSKIDACINVGSPGGNGIMALGRILTGDVNPSGKTVDLVYTNYKNDPTYQNFGGNFTGNGDAYLYDYGESKGGIKATDFYMVEYEEGLYYGYRYYETRGMEEAKKGNAGWYDENVVYPFGYGLSYTTFEETVTSEGGDFDGHSEFEIEVNVKNTGTVAGKQVVEVYAETPYTAGKIEKPYKVLAGFAKTKLLAAGEEEKVKISINPYYLASFDNKDKNGNGFKGYELDAGDYIFHVATDSHNDVATVTKALATGYKFEKDPITNYDVKPLFDNVTNGMKENLSREDFEGTFPHTVTDAERLADDALLKKLRSYNSGNNDEYTEMPTTNAEVEVMFKELFDLPYDDPKWEKFLDQLTFQEMLDLFNEGCYSTMAIERLGVPKTTSADGPTGFVAFLGDPAVYGTCYYQSECLLAQTYNLELAKEQANAIGNEALVGNENGDGLTYPGWYAPGVNIHRSPFSGRNTEYYSEDPFLNGRFAGTVIKNVQEKGVYVNVKHFALNDQETHRSAKGIATWADEQVIREIYLRPFEMAVKEGKALGLMSSFNRIGTTWAGGDYRLLTTVLRKEWGFIGSVICDFHTDYYMDSKQMLYAGGDLNLVSVATQKLQSDDRQDTPYVEATEAKDVNLLRQSAHHLLYSLANSNAMLKEVGGYRNPLWMNLETVATIVVGVGIVGWGAWAILSTLKKSKEVEAVAEAAK